MVESPVDAVAGASVAASLGVGFGVVVAFAVGPDEAPAADDDAAGAVVDEDTAPVAAAPQPLSSTTPTRAATRASRRRLRAGGGTGTVRIVACPRRQPAPIGARIFPI